MSKNCFRKTLYDLRVILPLLVVFFASCGKCPKEKFSITDVNSWSLENRSGTLVILNGYDIPNESSSVQSPLPLIHYLVVWPGAWQTFDSEYRTSNKNCLYAIMFNYLTDMEDVELGFIWDRSKDTVNVLGDTYNRASGNVFVVTIDLSGQVSAMQVKSFSTEGNIQNLMDHIREKLPNNKFIADISIDLQSSKTIPLP